MAVTFVRPAVAQETSFGHILTLQTGSLGKADVAAFVGTNHVEADDTLSVTLDVTFVNSAARGVSETSNRPASFPCRDTSGGYALDPKDSGAKLNESVLLSAYHARKRVRLKLDGCVFDKPRIISVALSAAND